MGYLPPLSDSLILELKKALVSTDEVAFDNVTHDNEGNSILDGFGRPIKGKYSRGGPFGAMLAISLSDGSFEKVGTPRGNNVVGSGIASRHAEDQALQPDNIQILTARLAQLSVMGLYPLVWVVSSGQSCPNCHTKQEILARELTSRNLLAPGRFVTLYGATYDDTLKIAQFYDAQYADALIFKSISPSSEENLICQDRIALQEAPFEVQNAFGRATLSTAVVMRNGHIYSVGTESRTETDLYATAEVNAVRAACVRNRAEGNFASWTVDGELYTTSSELGPLLFAEAAWTKIRKVRHVQMPSQLRDRQFETLETPDLGNLDFMKLVAGGYDDKRSSIRVIRDETFRNTAQPKWAEILKVNGDQLYNGSDVTPEVEALRNTHTRFRFSALDICSCGTHTSNYRPKRLLETVASSRPVNI